MRSRLSAPRMLKVLPIEGMDVTSMKVALAQSRMWLLKRWEDSDPRVLHMKLLRHAEIIERLEQLAQ